MAPPLFGSLPAGDYPAENAAMVAAAKASPASLRTVKRSSIRQVAIKTLTTKLSCTMGVTTLAWPV